MIYAPDAVPNDAPRGLRAWLARQLRAVADALREPEPNLITVAVLGVEPAKPRDGMIAFADGSEWDPGSGRGLYSYEGGAWVKL